MEECNYNDGDLLLKQGEAGGTVLQIISGKAEVSVEQNGRPIVLGLVESGGFLGEMGVIEGHTAHGATACALGPVSAKLMDREEFLRMVSSDDDLAYGLIERLISRLRATNDRLADSVAPVQPERASRITIYAERLMARPHISEEGLVIDSLPFAVGRNSRHTEPGTSLPELLLEDSRPFRMSRRHFVINRSGADVVVHDLESTLGTVVNGEAIGKHFSTDYANLRPGENTVVAGGDASPFVFRVHLS